MGLFDIFKPSSSSQPAASGAAAAAPAQPHVSTAHKGSELALTYAFEFDQFASSKSQEVLFMTTVQAPEFEPEGKTERAALDICAVIDKSGSMSGEKVRIYVRGFCALRLFFWIFAVYLITMCVVFPRPD